MSRIEELEKKLADKRAERAKAEEAQYELDLEARLALEDEHGTIAAVKVARFAPGQPTCAYLRVPTGPEYKRYKDQIHYAVEAKSVPKQQNAAETLAKSCWVYPSTDEAKKAMLDAFPGLLSPLANAAAALAEGKSERLGKE